MATNIFYLYLSLLLANYILPLITIPYLARALGKQAFGQYSTTLSLALLGQVLVEYGFHFWGSREVSLHREQKHYLQKLIGGAIVARFILFIAAFLLVFILTIFISTTSTEDRNLMLLAIVVWVASWVINPIWIYQGLEKMQTVAFLETTARIMGTTFIFISVHTPKDKYLPIIWLGGSALVANAIALAVLRKEIGAIQFNFQESLRVLKASFHTFIYRMGVFLFTSINPVFLALFSTNIQVAYYSGTEKFTRPLLGLLDPVNRALYPQISLLQKENPKKASKIVKRLFLFIGVGVGGLVTIIWATAPFIVNLFLGKDFTEATPVLRVLAVLLLPAAFSKTLGAHMFLARGLDKLMSKIYITAGLLNLALAPVAAMYGGALGVAITSVVVETWILLLMILVLKKHNDYH